MRKGQQPSPSAILAVAFSAAVAATVLADSSGLIAPAQAQSEAEKRKREQDRQKAAPPKPQPPPPSAKPPPAPPRATAPPPPPRTTSPPPAPPKATAPPPALPKTTAPPPPPPKVPLPNQQPPPEKPAKSFQPPPPPAAKTAPGGPPPAAKTAPGGPPPAAKTAPGGPPPGVDPKKEGIKRPPPPGPSVGPPPPKAPPGEVKKAEPPTVKPPAGPLPKRFEDVQKGRVERVEGGRKVIEERHGPGKRLIVKERDRSIIRHDEAGRFLRRPGAKSERRPDGNVETFYVRRDGVRIVTVVDGHGRLLRRYRRDRDGRERHIIDNRRFYLGVGIGIGIGVIILNLPPPRVTIPRERYIVEYESASDDDLDEALTASPIEPLERAYSLDEVRYNYQLRARMRRIDLDTIFDFGSWEVPPDQYDRLERVARAIQRVLRDNPEAVFLIEVHADEGDSEDDKLSLSDRRAQSIAEILSETFDIPPENLVTQGYGEQYLNIRGPRNRGVSIVNITPLMAER